VQVKTRKNIDAARWDTMIWNHDNALFYNLSWALDTLCPEWVGVIKGDYEAAIAIPIQRKVGVKYTFNPFLFHRISSIGELSQAEVDEALWMAAKYVDIRSREQLEGAVEWNNYELDLSSTYLEIVQSYSSNAKRNLKKANKNNLEFKPENNAGLISVFFKENVSFLKLGIKANEYENFEKLMLEALDCEIGKGFSVWHQDEIVASGFVVVFNGRITFVKGTSNEQGRELGAMPYLMDRIIEQYAGSKLIFDFAGSNVKSVGQFYHSFGAKNLPIYYLKRNNLPFPLNQIKK